jgi:O-glycosyl hydrolase
LCDGQRSDGASAVGGAIDRVVVQHDDFAVGGHAQVHLEHVDTERRRIAEGVQRVLRPQAPSATVRNDMRPAVAPERMRRQRFDRRADEQVRADQHNGEQCGQGGETS